MKPIDCEQKKSELRPVWKYYLQNVFRNHVFNIYVERGFGIK